jgi:protein-disulfide isomerase
MSTTRAVVLLLAASLLFSAVSIAQTDAQNSAVVAIVNGNRLTAADLEQSQGGKLLQAKYSYYEAQRKALDDLIDQQLLDQEAARQHLTVDQLLEKEVNTKIGPDPNDDALRVYYEGMETDKPFDEVKDKIRQHIRDVRINKAKAAYLVTLRKAAKISVELEPPKSMVALNGAPIRGNKDAQVVLVEFADYQCPYCQKIHPDIARLQAEFGDRLAVAFKDFPLPMHPNAEKAAEAARCAGKQGKFWEMHDTLFIGKKLEPDQLKEQASALHLDMPLFNQCLDSGETAAAIQEDAAEGRRLGLTGTPSFFANGHFFSGALTYAALRDMIAQQMPAASLSSKPAPSPAESSLR